MPWLSTLIPILIAALYFGLALCHGFEAWEKVRTAKRNGVETAQQDGKGEQHVSQTADRDFP